MSYVIFRSESINTLKDLGEIGAHNKRDKKSYKSNPDIDMSRSKNNIEIVPLNERYSKGYYELVKDYKKEYEEKQKTTREDRRKSFDKMLDDSNSVVADELMFTSDNDFFKGMSKKDIKDRIKYLNKTFDMESFLYQRIGTLSTGQTQRVSIARCLMHDPKYYILDEPTSGLDIISSKVILDTIKEEKDKGKCILYSTHYMEEAESICDRVVLMNNGKIITIGTPEEIKKKTNTSNLREAFFALTGGDNYE